MPFTMALGALALVLSVAVAGAQSLADVARAEEARRKVVRAPAKVYTNDDLRRDFTTPASAPVPAAPADGAVAAAVADPAAPLAAPAAAAPDAQPTPAGPPQDQAYWRGRMVAARTDLERKRISAEALQSRINALTMDFVNRDNPVERSVIEQDRLKALSELARVTKEIEAQTKVIADIEEEARRANVPAGWLRG